MSAAEKLKALDERAAYVTNLDLEPPTSSVAAIAALRRALPQIVALVEAAEKRRPDGTFYAQEIAAALAALEEVLS